MESDSINKMTNLALMWTAMTVIVLINMSPINFIVLRSWGVDIKGTPSPDTMQGTATDDDITGRNGDDIIDGLQGNDEIQGQQGDDLLNGSEGCLLYTSPSPRDGLLSRMPSSA